jgi:hypothetical protein
MVDTALKRLPVVTLSNFKAMKPSAKTNHLLVFGRYPRPGKTKTRLIPALGPAGAADLQRRLAEETVAAAKNCARRIGGQLAFYHDGGSRGQMERWLGKDDIAYDPQPAGDLGLRMYRAFETAFDRGGRRVVLVGTDVPKINGKTIQQAFDQLRQDDLVLGPSTDGGYWLVGMTRPVNIFSDIRWSTPTVLDETLVLARRMGLAAGLLEPLRDLDEPADLDTFGYQANPYLSVIVPTLNEEDCIAATLAAAAAPDAERIVSDGGSTDRTLERCRGHGVRIVTGAPGRAVQQNRGAAAARGEVLLFLHADTLLPGDYVAHIFEALMDRRVVLGAFRFQADAATPAMRWVAFWTNLRALRLNLPYGDQGLFLARSNFNAAGGFANVPIAEDLYLVRRMGRRGRIALAPAAVVTSDRRWKKLGVLQTTLINMIIALGCLAGVDPHRLAPLYRSPILSYRWPHLRR